MSFRPLFFVALIAGIFCLPGLSSGQAKVDPKKDIKKVDPKNVKKDPKKAARKWNLDSFVQEASVKPPEEQIKLVTEKLRELNQAFKDLTYAKIENGVVAKVGIDTYVAEDISPLKVFAKMTELSANSSVYREGKVTDLSWMVELKLQSLELNNNGELTDISVIKGMPLKRLYFHYTSVNSINALEGCDTLDDLRFIFSKVTNLKPLKGLKLKTLMASNNKNDQGQTIADLSPLTGMMLQTCHLGAVSATNFAVLKPMPIEDLSVADTPISDFSVLKDMPLKSLDVIRTKFTEKDGQFVKSKPIATLYLNSTPIKDLGFVKDMPLTVLSCYYCQQLSSLAPLVDKKITWLIVSGTAIKELKPLAGMPLVRFDCADTNVVSLEPLRGAPISYLDLQWGPKKGLSPLTDIKVLSSMPLGYLYLTNTSIKDVKPLAGTPVHTLHIQGTKVKDFAILKDAQKLSALYCDHQLPRDAAALKQIKSLRTLNGQNAQNILQ